jgi:hypothetical protein
MVSFCCIWQLPYTPNSQLFTNLHIHSSLPLLMSRVQHFNLQQLQHTNYVQPKLQNMKQRWSFGKELIVSDPDRCFHHHLKFQVQVWGKILDFQWKLGPNFQQMLYKILLFFTSLNHIQLLSSDKIVSNSGYKHVR